MKYLLLVILLVAVSPLSAQVNLEGMDEYPLMEHDGLRIFFDASVEWMWGGIIMEPYWEFIQTQTVTDAYLVLTWPTAAALGGYRVRMQLDGGHVVLSEEVVGLPLSVLLEDDLVSVVYDPPLPLNGDPVVLYHWSLLNPAFTPVAFYLMPPEGSETPVYLDGDGVEIPADTYNGAFHEYTAPVIILNGYVTPNEAASWGEVKNLFR